MKQLSFSPYTDNGGTTLAVAGDDFCIIAGDTRQSEGYLINCRYAPKVFPLTPAAVLATGGMHADAVALVNYLSQVLENYSADHAQQMSVTALAQRLSVTLYSKRFFPYYVWNTLGKGCVFSYDPVGNFERRLWNCAGSAGHLIQPFLDNQNPRSEPLSIDQAKRIVKDAFHGATERDIYTGDFLEIYTVTASGTTKEVIPLKRD